MSTFDIYDSDIDRITLANPICRAVRTAWGRSDASKETMYKAMVLAMHSEMERLKAELADASWGSMTYQLMTDGIELPDGKRYVFRPRKDSE